jgi:hypothetical protein
MSLINQIPNKINVPYWIRKNVEEENIRVWKAIFNYRKNSKLIYCKTSPHYTPIYYLFFYLTIAKKDSLKNVFFTINLSIQTVEIGVSNISCGAEVARWVHNPEVDRLKPSGVKKHSNLETNFFKKRSVVFDALHVNIHVL